MMAIDINFIDFFNQNEIHIWMVDTEYNKKDLQHFWPVLSSHEEARAKRFHFDYDRDLYVVSHGALRKILSRYINQIPENIQISYTEKSKPYLSGSHVQFNLSHSHKLAAIVIGTTTSLGIDIEYLGKKNFDALDIAKHFFAGEEYSQLLALPTKRQHNAFLETWTRKEAFIKATGDGLSFPVQEFVVNVPPKPPVLSFLKEHRFSHDPWYFQTLSLPQDYVGTVAYANYNATIVYYDYSSFHIM